MKIQELITSLPFWNHLSETEKQMVFGTAFLKSYKKGSIIHSTTDKCLGMILVNFGEIRTYLLSKEGREITLFKMYEGDPCILSASCIMEQITFDTHMIAESDTELLIINAIVFQKLTEDNIHVRCFMYELATQRFSTVMWIMQQILFLGFDKRLASFLIKEHERTGSLEIHMTHEQIAKDIGSAREVVARMFKRFAADDLVKIERGTVILKDIDALKNIYKIQIKC